MAPELSEVQRIFVDSEIQWMRSGFTMIREVQEVVHKELQRSTFPVQVLACPHVSTMVVDTGIHIDIDAIG